MTAARTTPGPGDYCPWRVLQGAERFHHIPGAAFKSASGPHRGRWRSFGGGSAQSLDLQERDVGRAKDRIAKQSPSVVSWARQGQANAHTSNRKLAITHRAASLCMPEAACKSPGQRGTQGAAPPHGILGTRTLLELACDLLQYSDAASLEFQLGLPPKLDSSRPARYSSPIVLCFVFWLTPQDSQDVASGPTTCRSCNKSTIAVSVWTMPTETRAHELISSCRQWRVASSSSCSVATGACGRMVSDRMHAAVEPRTRGGAWAPLKARKPHGHRCTTAALATESVGMRVQGALTAFCHATMPTMDGARQFDPTTNVGHQFDPNRKNIAMPQCPQLMMPTVYICLRGREPAVAA
jgi:hypothetical protein